MKFKLWFGFLLSVALLFVVFFRIDFGALLESLKRASPALLLAAVVPLLLTQLIKAWRWRHLMLSLKSVPAGRLLPATVIGAMVDMIFPARGGDIARACLVGSQQKVSKTATLATLVVEKTWDMGIILVIAVPMLLFFPFPENLGLVATSLRTVVLIAALACGIVFGFWILASTGRISSDGIAARPLELLPEKWQGMVLKVFSDFSQGLKGVQTVKGVLAVAASTIVLWAAFAAGNFLILKAFTVDVPAYAAVILLVFQVFGVTLPSSPGFIGTYHAAVVAGFALFGVGGEEALGLAIAMHAAFFFPFIAAGMGFLWFENLSFREVRSLEDRSTGVTGG